MSSSAPAGPVAESAAPKTTSVVAPRLVSEATVSYPDGATGDATVVLALTIGVDGKVREASALSGDEPFRGAAIATARRWQFEPATRSGAAVAAKIRFEVVFHAPVLALPAVPEENPYGPEPAAEAAPKPPPPPHEILVQGTRPEPSRSATLSRSEVRQIPGTFGDPFRAIEVMPGVTPIVSGLPFFFVRGAPPGDVGYFLDGIRVPLLFHVGVGPSVVHPAIMDRVDLYPGGYPARFGRFSGGIVAGETVDPGVALHGEYNVRLFDAGAFVETPFAGGRGTLLASGRYSYTAALLTLLSSDTELNYWDYQARATYDVSRDDRVSVFAFGSYDYLGQITPTQTITLFGAEFHRADVRYDHRIADKGQIRLAVTAGVDRSRLPSDRFLRDESLGMRSELRYRLSPNVLFRGGVDVAMDAYDVELNTSELSQSQTAAASAFPSRTDVSLGQRADLVISPFTDFEIIPGARFDYFSSEGNGALAFDPRLATRLRLSNTVTLLSSFGIAHQPPAFVIPAPGFQPGGLRGGLQEALQESAGAEFDLGNQTTLTTTGFHNAFFNMSDPLGGTVPVVGGCPPGAFPADTVSGDRGSQPTGNPFCQPRFPSGLAGPDLSGGSGLGGETTNGARTAQALQRRTMGTSFGLEIFLKKKLTSRLGGFLSYTLSRSIRNVDRQTFVASFDRAHVANAALAYDLGRHWRAGTRVTFYTGLPKAPDPTTSSTRLPPFFRVDLRLEKRWQLGETTWISMVAEWMNATLSKEAVSTTCDPRGCQAQMIGPVTIPSLGVEGGF